MNLKLRCKIPFPQFVHGSIGPTMTNDGIGMKRGSSSYESDMSRLSTVQPFDPYRSNSIDKNGVSKYELDSRIDRLCLDGIGELKAAETKLARVVWCLLLMAGVITAVVQCVFTLQTYRMSPILTSTNVQVNESLRFPAIYICPMNAVNKTKADRKEHIDLARQFLMAGQKVNPSETSILNQMLKTSDIANGLLAGSYAVPKGRGDPGPPPPDKAESLFNQIGYDKSAFILDCGFSQRRSCNQSMFVERFDQDFGRCFLLPEDLFSQSSAGHGLSLALDIHRDQYHPEFKPITDGVRIVAAYDFDPTLDKTGSGVFAQPGQVTDIVLSATNYQLINVDTGVFSQTCRSSDDTRKFKYSNLKYSLTACRWECMQSVAISECACLLPMDSRDLAPGFDENHVCTINVTAECFFEQATRKRINEIKACIKECKVPCESSEIDYRISSLKISTAFDESIDSNDVQPPLPQSIPQNISGTIVWIDPPNPYQDLDATGTTDQWSSTESTVDHTMSTDQIQSTTSYQESIVPQEQIQSDEDERWRKREEKRRLRDTVVINVAFGDLRYSQIIQTESMTFDTFVANIGGQLGLWIGASIVSLVQLCFLAIHFCYVHCKGKKRATAAHTIPPPPHQLYSNDVHVS